MAGNVPLSRRAILGAAAGAVAVVTARAVGEPGAAQGASGDPVILGQENAAQGTTYFRASPINEPALSVFNDAPETANGSGIWARVRGGGYALGGSSENGVAVTALSFGGTAVRAENPSGGTALEVLGRVKFDCAGKLTIPKGRSSYRVTLPRVAASSQAFAVLRTHRPGRYITAVVCGPGYFTIYLNRALMLDSNCSYFVVN
jgi:hypothetical protein